AAMSNYLLILLLLRGPIYRLTVSYQTVGDRALSQLPAGELYPAAQAWAVAHPNASVQQISRFATRKTAAELSFVARAIPSDPATTLRLSKANCVGYSRLYGAIVAAIIANLPPERQLTQQHLMGKIKVFGYDLHQLTSTPFWADHDFNCLADLATGETVCSDPTLNDYLGIRMVSRSAK
ncbi:MAG: hypothetical protein AAF597_10655, partial [Bacteroidota bacterium]